MKEEARVRRAFLSLSVEYWVLARSKTSLDRETDPRMSPPKREAAVLLKDLGERQRQRVRETETETQSDRGTATVPVAPHVESSSSGKRRASTILG